MNILDKIIEQKKIELQSLKTIENLTEFSRRAENQRAPFSLKKKFMESETVGVIAEFKRKSPSKGIINANAELIETTNAYAQAGAFALSVLTDTEFFGGTLSDLEQAAQANNIPVLRKDFIIDQYQIVQARAAGASLVLLIAEALDKKEVLNLAKYAKAWHLEVLLEVHSKEELEKVNDYVDFVGVNNRNLKTFEVSLDTSVELAQHIPAKFIKIAESGIKSPEDVKYLAKYGFKGFLIGENFMKTTNPGNACKEFIEAL